MQLETVLAQIDLIPEPLKKILESPAIDPALSQSLLALQNALLSADSEILRTDLQEEWWF
jgi:hypothetical protein